MSRMNSAKIYSVSHAERFLKSLLNPRDTADQCAKYLWPFFFSTWQSFDNFRKLPNIVWDLSDSFRLDYWKWKTWQGWSRLTSLSLVFIDQTTVRIRTFVKCMSKRSKKLRKTFVKWYGTARRTLTLTTLCTSQHKRCSSVLLYQSCFKLL